MKPVAWQSHIRCTHAGIQAVQDAGQPHRMLGANTPFVAGLEELLETSVPE